MKQLTLLLLFCISSFTSFGQVEKYTISGHIRDAGSGEEMINATLYIDQLGAGVVTNVYGFYSITLEKGNYDLKFSYLGFEDFETEINLSKDRVLNIELKEVGQLIEELVITAKEEDDNVEEVAMSKVDLDIATVKKIPALLGEVDVVKALQLLPGVATVGEGTSGFYVRGGNVDQNLILLDEAPVYNASHMLGFFSVFNPDAIKDVQLYKGAIPAEYGGRLSSVVDIRMKEGNSKKFSGDAGIGTISSRLTVGAPIGEKGSFMLSGRRTYIDLFLKLSEDEDTRNSQLYFYDLNAKFNYRLGEKDRIFLSAYTGKDLFGEKNDFSVGWGNTTTTLRWNHLFSQKLFSNLTLYRSDYRYKIGEESDVDAFEWTANQKDYGLKYDFGFYQNHKSMIKFGVQTIFHSIQPGEIKGLGESILNDLEFETTKAIENGAYVAHELGIGSRLKLNYGIRVSSLHNIGPKTVYTLDENYKDVDTTVYSGSKIYNNYYNFEPRVGLKYSIDENSSLKLSYNRTSQYIHLASNSTSASPLDVWFLSGPNIKPQLADQFAMGYFKNFNNNTIEASVELYYKNFKNAIDFRDHAQLIANARLDQELRYGKARAYGMEFFLKKNKGRFTGWISYTLAKSEKKIDEINNGNWYNAKYDKTHDFAIVASYALSDRIDISANWIYQTGSAVTFPTGKFYQYGQVVPVYSERNAERMPAYHRLDLSVTWDLKKKLFGSVDQSLAFSIYNAYGRKNAYRIAFREDEANPQKTIAEKTYLFSIVPSLTYNVKF